MKINKRLKLSAWFSLTSLLFILFSLAWALWTARQANDNLLLVHEIERTAFERIILRDNWLFYPEERAKTQWYAKTEYLRTLLDSATDRFTASAAKALLQDAKENFAATASLFPMILESHKQNALTAQKKLAYTEAQARIISQVFLKAYSLNDNISKLHELARKEELAARNKGVALVIIFIIIGVTAMVVNSTLISDIVTKRIKELLAGIAIIGVGNLEHRLSIKGNDELADLAQEINEMTQKLKQSYTSVKNLEKEITEREKIEKKIIKLSARQQALLSAIPDIIMEVDNNKIYTWVNEPGKQFFGNDVIGKEAAFFFEGKQDTYAKVAAVFEGAEDTIYVESWQRRQDGEKRLLSWWCRALKDEKGNVIGALSTARDITEQKIAQEEIRKLNEELEQRVAQRTAELMTKTAELERINKVFVERELRMRELKKRIEELEKISEAHISDKDK